MKTHKITRRNFIAKNATMAGGVLLSPTFMSMRPLSKKIRIGIVGGRFGRTFQFHEHPDCTVEAVSDLLPERRKALMETYKCDKS